MHKLVFLCLYVLSINSFAYSLNVGTYVPYAFEAQDENAGNTTTLALNPVFSVAGLFSTPWSFYFNPEIGYVHHRNTSDEIEKNRLINEIKDIRITLENIDSSASNYTSVKVDNKVEFLKEKIDAEKIDTLFKRIFYSYL